MYNGFINILKPTGMTSHDVVGKLRYLTKMKKIGHTGTLDPNAAGVLPICLGAATKFSDYAMEKEKTYIGEIYLGVSTTTLDTYGEVETKTSVPNIDQALVVEVLNSFLGEGTQIPPKYSAIKINGEKLYSLARQGKEIPEIKPRKINIYYIELVEFKLPKIVIKVRCSSGTYIRTLASDISNEIGLRMGMDLVGCLSLLIRTEAGPMKIENALTLEEIEILILEEKLKTVDVDEVLDNLNSISIGEEALTSYKNGGEVGRETINFSKEEHFPTGLHKVYCNGKFLGVGEALIKNQQWSLKAKTQYQIF